ncbi:tetratricopeptide repeat protein [Anaerococcus sp. mt242]|uniref:tetratricopeptide repeat protein n=1 Tax=Anaerococcus sp. mt242 TaxID=2661917 RepID=UPI001933DEBB|nr:tetratricopeptide repeat protein [Anaerococcus sp. mt242]MBM0046996.1 tetratricopeptide repeat protein [Anaerococcus sp. mt242]
MKLDNYFIKFTENLAYLDLKDSSSYPILEDVPLPIYVDDIQSGIMTGTMSEKIELENFLDGMIINIGADKDFLHNEEYKIILTNFLDDISKYASSKAMAIADKDINKALLLLRGGYILNPIDNYNAYLYARFLWPQAFEAKDKFKEDFIREALNILQNIISNDENFAISYYELGNIYTNLGEYIKARSFYNIALQKTDSIEAQDEIRDKLTEINDNAEIEEALYFIGKSDYNGAIKKLTGLLSNKKRADAYYYLGVAYQNVGQYENSIMAFENALDAGAEFRELYNDYAVSLFLNERQIDALEIIEEGLEKYPQDPRLVYNKIQVNLTLGNIGRAREEIDELLSYDDLTDEIRSNLLTIKDQFKI